MPQPSDDPNDPYVICSVIVPYQLLIHDDVHTSLNWPKWRKEACFWML